ncbi:NAD(P)-dependent glycerol-1-phosphate dehydrogenase [Candidatus Bathyarchaeota archaeon]|jgi:glycerol-1-phosphate dehydrogenase [NAD(P)+]|nr:NAD(P)-dependent glycerol-1-phosphate dehydrogenase [Candidatus Bathyarchaeota archaeon]MBT4320570.1 NAD(P)-dependent glycerol-1-phosphate dehydrogenase [Candidatus Bathyarchaeota archaeon]MBT4423520.1 NAD(P)-dependent glycerol-1-phosphate dehydrogenase [Candidatus Bathyarchaeota archaeon]MBT6604206.1 NAD(P)-dependent glycerol-1-phosphate dehydrogenase [Candidatus Bathyarchaeota archaeon]MBT7188443.1 NAD(P)-dependent glycerol-1-phosphate dehydrogenase [Candidatus Bathyarchaeota archaeon]
MSTDLSDPDYSQVHRITLPRIVLVGENLLGQISDICVEQNFGKALIVTGERTIKIAGQKTIDYLTKGGIHTECMLVGDAKRSTVDNVISSVKAFSSDVVLGIGGGRNIDVAKLAAHESGRFFISVPTVASHDGIASNLASIKGSDRPYSVKATSPLAVVMDSSIIAKSPYRFTASGCGDMICKAVEVRDWRLAHRENNEYYGGYAASLSLMSSQHIMERANLIKARVQEGIRTLLEALVSCGVSMSIAGSSKPTSGSSHLFSHSLDLIAEKPALHGEQCGVGSIMMAKLHGLNWEALRDSLQTIGAPITADELGVGKDVIVKALTMAQSLRPNRYTILNKHKLDEKKAEELAEVTGVI